MKFRNQYDISTHAPHARRGGMKFYQMFPDADFYSRASCEARLAREQMKFNAEHFYSRASCEARQLHQHKLLQFY